MCRFGGSASSTLEDHPLKPLSRLFEGFEMGSDPLVVQDHLFKKWLTWSRSVKSSVKQSWFGMTRLIESMVGQEAY